MIRYVRVAALADLPAGGRWLGFVNASEAPAPADDVAAGVAARTESPVATDPLP